MSEKNDALIRKAQAGDRKATEQLLDSFVASLYRYGIKMCRNQEDAKDIAQDTLLAASKNIGSFRFASSFTTWLYTIARRACLMRRRRKKHDPSEVVSLHDIPQHRGPRDHTTRAPDELVMQHQLSAAVQKALDGLDQPRREVLFLRDVEGLTAPEVAEVLGITPEAVKSRLHRARLHVRRELETFRHREQPTKKPRKGCPDVLRLFSKHLEGDIDANLCKKMERHLRECPECRDECDSLKETLALCRTHERSLVPAAMQQEIRAKLKAALGSDI